MRYINPRLTLTLTGGQFLWLDLWFFDLEHVSHVSLHTAIIFTKFEPSELIHLSLVMFWLLTCYATLWPWPLMLWPTSNILMYHLRQEKLHHFIFAIALSERRLLWQFLAHIYFNRVPIIRILHILSVIRDGEPA